MQSADVRRAVGIVLTNYHPQARSSGQTSPEENEEQADRLARALVAQGQFKMTRVGNSLDTLSSSVRAVIRHELGVAATLEERPAVVLAYVAGHGVVEPESGPCLLARDVYLHLKEDGLIPLSGMLDRLEECEPGHLVIILDFRPLRQEALLAPLVLGGLGRRKVPHSTIVLTGRAEGGFCGGLVAAGFEGAGVNRGTGFVTVRSLAEYLKHLCGGVKGEGVLFETSLGADEDVELLVPGSDVATQLGAEVAWGEVGREESDLPRGVLLPGRLQVRERVGQGGFGTVYLAEQLDLNREVAVKVLSGGVEHGDGVVLFLREMRAVASLGHRNIVAIYQSGRLPDGRPFCVMEMLTGETVRQRMDRRKRITREEAVDIACQVLSGLAHAHQRGVLHRDIKPENIMLVPMEGARERAVILDFGIARWREEQSEGKFPSAGTPGYSSPEQLRGEAVRESDDTYAVGVILCELIVGVRPADLEGFEGLVQLMREANVPPALSKTLTVAVNPNPEMRFASASDFSDALQGTGHEYSDSRARLVRARRPFRYLEAFREEDQSVFFGREDEVRRLTDRVLFSRCLILTASTGVGKTSLLQAGVVPRARELGMMPVYVDCRGEPVDAALALLEASGDHLLGACLGMHQKAGARVCLVFDQVEALYGPRQDGEEVRRRFEEQVAQLVRADIPPVSVILSVRSEALAHMTTLRRQLLLSAHSEFTLDDLTIRQARRAVRGPMRLARVEMSETLALKLEQDLQKAVGRNASASSRTAGCIHAPFLQLACSLLFDVLEPGERLLTEKHLERLGGIPGILGGHLMTTLERELLPSERSVARMVLEALSIRSRSNVATTESVIRSETDVELSPVLLKRTLTVLETHRIVQQLQVGAEPSWVLAHPILTEAALRVLGEWKDPAAVARELLRKRVLEADGQGIALLSGRELSQGADLDAAAAQVDRELAALSRQPLPRVGAVELVRRSRERRRRRRMISGVAMVLLALLAASGLWSLYRVHRVASLNLGVMWLSFRGLETGHGEEWRAVSVDDLPDFRFEVHQLRELETSAVGPLVLEGAELSPNRGSDGERLVRLELPAAPYVIAVYGRHRKGEPDCGPSILSPVLFPGHDERSTTDRVSASARLEFPLCSASRAAVKEIPEGLTLLGSRHQQLFNPLRSEHVAPFGMDVREVSVDQFRRFAATLAEVTAVSQGPFLDGVGEETLEGLSGQGPAVYVSWYQARSFCLWMGKDLPTEAQWMAAARGVSMEGGASLAQPGLSRAFPWGDRPPLPGQKELVANFRILPRAEGEGGELFPVDSCQEGVSPMGILNMSGNAAEWVLDSYVPTSSAAMPGETPESAKASLDTPKTRRLVLGGHYFSVSLDELQLGVRRSMPPTAAVPYVGFRCVSVSRQ